MREPERLAIRKITNAQALMIGYKTALKMLYPGMAKEQMLSELNDVPPNDKGERMTEGQLLDVISEIFLELNDLGDSPNSIGRNPWPNDLDTHQNLIFMLTGVALGLSMSRPSMTSTDDNSYISDDILGLVFYISASLLESACWYIPVRSLWLTISCIMEGARDLGKALGKKIILTIFGRQVDTSEWKSTLEEGRSLLYHLAVALKEAAREPKKYQRMFLIARNILYMLGPDDLHDAIKMLG